MIDTALFDPASATMESDYFTFRLTFPNGWMILGSRQYAHSTGMLICNGSISLLAFKDGESCSVLVRSADDFRSFVREIAEQ